MRATSQIHATIVALVAAARVALPAPFEVYDGPSVDQNNSPDVMWLGLDDPDSELPVSATGTADWGSIGNNARDERFTVYGCTFSWSGDENKTSDGSADVFSQLRARAFGNLAAFETAVRTDPSVGAVLKNGSPLWQVGFQVVRVAPVIDPDRGSGVLVGFQLLCWCRI